MIHSMHTHVTIHYWPTNACMYMYVHGFPTQVFQGQVCLRNLNFADSPKQYDTRYSNFNIIIKYHVNSLTRLGTE